MRIHKIILGVFASSVLLASCTSRGPATPQIAIAPAPEPVKVEPLKPEVIGINGRWVPTDPDGQFYYNQFRNGKFVTKSPDGKSTIAAGTYNTLPNGDIEMNWYSEARKTNSSASCKKLSKAEMQCTSGGSVFNLRRA